MDPVIMLGKVLCASCKIERRSSVIQRLFRSSNIIADSFPQESCMARDSWGIVISLSGNDRSSIISFVVGMSATFSVKHPFAVSKNSLTSWPYLVKFTTWSTTKRVDSLSGKKKEKNNTMYLSSSSFLYNQISCITPQILTIFQCL